MWIKKPYKYAGTDSMANMIRRVAHTLADTSKTEADLVETLDETQLIDAQKLRTLAGIVHGPKPETVSFTPAEFKAFVPDRFHSVQKPKTLE